MSVFSLFVSYLCRVEDELTPSAAPNITYFKCDLSDMEQIKSVMARIREEVGNPTVLGMPKFASLRFSGSS
jgi:NAD(P)-dependent dehydrogenase (short-subunit alcohol dehydrogenase family)